MSETGLSMFTASNSDVAFGSICRIDEKKLAQVDNFSGGSPYGCDMTQQGIWRFGRRITMKSKALFVPAIILAASLALSGQTGLTGKWQTDNVPAALEAQKNAPPAEPGGRGGRGGGGGQAIIMD